MKQHLKCISGSSTVEGDVEHPKAIQVGAIYVFEGDPREWTVVEVTAPDARKR